MNLKNQRPIFVPEEFQRELDKLSKAALMDIAWDYATRVTGAEHPFNSVMAMSDLRKTAELIVMYRKRAKTEE